MTRLVHQRRLRRQRLSQACCIAGVLIAGTVHGADVAASLRDPMVPPTALNQAPRNATSDAAPPPMAMPKHLLLIDGQRFVVEGSQRFGVGAAYAGGRIERIDDSSVWLRDADGLHQLSLYGGVAKRAAGESAAASAAASHPAAHREPRVKPIRPAEQNPNR